MAGREVGEALMARELLELLRDAEDYGAYKALLWLRRALSEIKAQDIEDVEALLDQAMAALNETVSHRWAVSHFIFEPHLARRVPVLIPKDLWLKAREAAEKLGRDPEELLIEAVKEHKERIMEKLTASHGHGA